MKDRELWAKIEARSLTVPVGETLEHVLGRDSALGPKRAVIALGEFRRWLYLDAISGGVAVPPPAMEQMRGWLTEGHPPAGQQKRWQEPGYAATLVAYREEFGMAPPGSLWPEVAALKKQNRVAWWVAGGGVLFVVGLFTALFPVAILGAVLAGIPLVLQRSRGPWDAGLKGTSGSTDGGGDSDSGGE